MPYPWSSPITSRVFSTISASVPGCTTFFVFIKDGRRRSYVWDTNRSISQFHWESNRTGHQDERCGFTPGQRSCNGALKGTLDMMNLGTLAGGDAHGHTLAR